MNRQFIDHTGLSVEDIARAKAFYVAALAPLGISLMMELPASVTGSVDVAGFGAAGNAFFWLAAGGKQTHTHIAFGASTRSEVDAFHSAALAAGGTDNGGPGVREHYHPNYYGAFVLDPDGHNIEAVCHYSLAQLTAPQQKAAAPARKKSAKKTAKKKVAARKAPRKTAVRKKVSAKKAAARKPAKKAAVAKKAVRKPAGRGRKTRR